MFFAVIFPPYPVWQNENPPIPDANLLGLANVKYIGSTYDLVNIDFELIQNFDDIKIYKNNKYKKRAFFEHSSENVTVTSYKPNEIELRFKKSSDFRNLILSEKVYVDSRPFLEILANDVFCTHGSTTGKINEESLFYLKSRGLDQKTAEKL